MRREFGWALAVVLSSTVIGVGAASAADMALKARPAPIVAAAVYNWTGFYVGVNGGGVWGRNDVSGVFFDGDANATARTLGGLAGPGRVDGSSAIGGVQAGYNWQGSTPWVIGVEADIQGMSLKETRTSAIFTVAGRSTQDFDKV